MANKGEQRVGNGNPQNTSPGSGDSAYPAPQGTPEAMRLHAASALRRGARILTIRLHSGLSGDMMLAGLTCLAGLDQVQLDSTLARIFPELKGCAHLERAEVHHVCGWRMRVELPHAHAHRNLESVTALVAASKMCAAAKHLALEAFRLLALAEGHVHGTAPEAVHFHEVGALDSILDTCLSSELFVRLDPACLVVSPLPLADGSVSCMHGVIPVPAPAVMELMAGIPVRAFNGEGETVTPTAIALLRAFGATYGPWPAMCVQRHALAYGTRVFDNAPNGALFALGTACDAAVQGTAAAPDQKTQTQDQEAEPS